MQPFHIVLLIAAYFLVLFLISYFTGRDDSNETFFKARNRSKWYLVAFGMIGASLSGVTFISVPGWVRDSQFSYMQVVLGYALGYVIITFVLLPVYYRLQVTSVYEYLRDRFGIVSYKTGALFFLISRLVISAFGLYLVATILQQYIFDAWGIPFALTVVMAVVLIWLYTSKGGINTIIWTDVFQTFFMLSALAWATYFMLSEMNWTLSDFISSEAIKPYSRIFYTDDILAKNYFWKAFTGGVLITVSMTGLDQDMMQKNLTCKDLPSARKNMLSYGMTFIPINIVFLLLGALLFIYAGQIGMDIPERTDLLFPELVLNGHLGSGLAVVFILGLIAAAYSSADSALTALTTSFCIDFLELEHSKTGDRKKIRKRVHIGMSLALIVIIISYNYLLSSNIIDLLLTAVTYTYGPVLGLFAFGLCTKKKVKDKYVIYIALLAAGTTFVLGQIPAEMMGGYRFNYELLAVNGGLMFLGMWLIRKRA